MSAKSLLTFLLFSVTVFASGQQNDSIKGTFSAFISVTNNGISFIPTFSFEKPSGTVIISLGGERLSFEPDFRFTLNMERGGMAFWWRYKLIRSKKFNMITGAHPALNLIPLNDPISGKKTGTLETQRFIAGELSPVYSLSNNVTLGIYYLYGHGLQDNGPRNAHFITVNSNISNIPLFSRLTLQLIPQIYYLVVDVEDGLYFTNTLTISKPGFPLMIQSTINKIITTNISGSRDFQWNVSLSYYFSRDFAALK